MKRWIVVLWVGIALLAFLFVRQGLTEALTQNMRLESGYTYAGTNAMNILSNYTSQQCGELCELSQYAPYCKATVYDTAKKTCQMKQDLGTKTSTPGVDTYVKKVAVPVAGYQEMPNIDFPGNDLSSFDNLTMETCASKCDETQDCKGTVFDAHYNKCYLKKELQSSAVKFVDGLHTYSKIPPVWPAPAGYVVEVGYVYDKAVMIGDPTMGSTPEKCVAACTANKECKGAAIESVFNYCYLQKDIEGTAKSPYPALNTYLKSTATVTTEEGDWTKQTNTAYPNPDGSTVLGTFPNLTDADCKTKCADSSSCKGFTNYAYTAGGSSCLLMSTTDGAFNYAKEGETANSYKYNKPIPPPPPAPIPINFMGPLRAYVKK